MKNEQSQALAKQCSALMERHCVLGRLHLASVFLTWFVVVFTLLIFFTPQQHEPIPWSILSLINCANGFQFFEIWMVYRRVRSEKIQKYVELIGSLEMNDIPDLIAHSNLDRDGLKEALAVWAKAGDDDRKCTMRYLIEFFYE